MKLLFDQNLSPKLVQRLADLFPESAHVDALGMGCSDDVIIWEYSLQGGYTIVSKDADYDSLSVLRGTPPKVIWLQLGNCTTEQVESAIRARAEEIEHFGNDPAWGTLAIG